MPFDPHCKSVVTPSSELVERYLRAQQAGDASESLMVVHYRGTRHGFAATLADAIAACTAGAPQTQSPQRPD